MAFLEILTRCYKRPKMLHHNRASLVAQTCGDWTQTLLVDEVGHGVPAAQERLAHYAPQLTGEYIWILDDDDMCTRRTLVDELRTIAKTHQPDVIMLRMNHLERGILPDDDAWQKPPQCSRIGCSAYVVRRDVWRRFANAFLPGEYASDFKFIAAIFAARPNVFWHDVIASQCQRVSLGRAEAA